MKQVVLFVLVIAVLTGFDFVHLFLHKEVSFQIDFGGVDSGDSGASLASSFTLSPKYIAALY